MPYRPEAELKRPDLKGEFLCGHCGKTFCHAASLNRHRLNFHGDDQQCLVCMQQISPNDTVRRHMSVNHGIQRVFTCGCCNWTFPDKKELHSHNNSMLKTGKPGDAKAIAISSRPPGSLSQHELKGEERTPTRINKKKARTSLPATSSNASPINPSINNNGNAFMDMFSLLSNPLAASNTTQFGGNQMAWMSTLLMNNPTFLQFLQQQQQMQTIKEQMDEEQSFDEKRKVDQVSPTSDRASTSMTASSPNSFISSIFSTKEASGEEETTSEIGFKMDDDHLMVSKSFARDLLIVRTDPSESSSSGPESGIGSSGEDACTPSPSSISIRSKEGSPESVEENDVRPSSSPLDVVNLLASPSSRKRKSVDAIASLLFKKKCLME